MYTFLEGRTIKCILLIYTVFKRLAENRQHMYEQYVKKAAFSAECSTSSTILSNLAAVPSVYVRRTLQFSAVTVVASGVRLVDRRTVNRGDGGSIPLNAVLKFLQFISPHNCLFLRRTH